MELEEELHELKEIEQAKEGQIDELKKRLLGY